MADSTPSTTPVDLPAAELRDTIAGEVVTPDDPSYEQLRFAAYHEGRPAVVVRCSTHDDIRQAVQFARAHDLPLSVRGGGHSGAGFGTNEGGLVVELSQFDAVEVLDAERGLVRVGAGAKWGAVADALAPHGLAITSGDTRSVGVSGLTLGGGIGWFVRQFGLTVDVLVTAEILLADGQVVRASADDNAELFWALRGGGGNFGVVTAFEFWAAPIRQVLVGTFAYPRAEAAAVLKSWRDHMRSAPDELNATAMVMPEIPGGPPQFSLTVCVPADDEQAARALVEPFRQFGSVDGESLRVVAYPDALEDPPHPPPG